MYHDGDKAIPDLVVHFMAKTTYGFKSHQTYIVHLH